MTTFRVSDLGPLPTLRASVLSAWFASPSAVSKRSVACSTSRREFADDEARLDEAGWPAPAGDFLTWGMCSISSVDMNLEGRQANFRTRKHKSGHRPRLSPPPSGLCLPHVCSSRRERERSGFEDPGDVPGTRSLIQLARQELPALSSALCGRRSPEDHLRGTLLSDGAVLSAKPVSSGQSALVTMGVSPGLFLHAPHGRDLAGTSSCTARISPLTRCDEPEFPRLTVRGGAVADNSRVMSPYIGQGLGRSRVCSGRFFRSAVPGRDPQAVG
jgi:hypothetical protein